MTDADIGFLSASDLVTQYWAKTLSPVEAVAAVPRPGGPASFAAGAKVVHVDRVEWHVIPDAATAAAALQRGEVDWWEQPTADLIPLLRRDPNLVVEAKEHGGSMSMIRFNHLQPPFDNPAIRRAFFPGIKQADYMTAVMGDDRSLWTDRCGFFLPGGPFSTEAGLDVMDGAPDYERVKANLQAAGYKGERVVFVVPTDLPSLNAFSETAADMFRRVGEQAGAMDRAVRRALPLLGLLALAACDLQPHGPLPSNRFLEQNAPSSRDYTPANSLPRGF